MALELRLSSMGYRCWLDQKAETITKESMQAGVEASKVFLLFLSRGVLSRPFCLFEIRTALTGQKKILLMHETDERHGAFDFGEVNRQALPDMTELLETHESIPWRRRRFEQDAILAELIRTAGLAAPDVLQAVVINTDSGTDTAVKSAGNDAIDGVYASGMAPVVDAVPVIPESFNPRQDDSNLVLDVLLSRTKGGSEQQKVLAHGMGGLGKTTMAAAVARNEAVRRHYSRVALRAQGLCTGLHSC